jgi:hypothetical protein
MNKLEVRQTNSSYWSDQLAKFDQVARMAKLLKEESVEVSKLLETTWKVCKELK